MKFIGSVLILIVSTVLPGMSYAQATDGTFNASAALYSRFASGEEHDGAFVLDESTLRAVIKESLKDRQLSPFEKDMLIELYNGPEQLTVTHGEDSINLIRPVGEARRILGLVTETPNLNDLWNQGGAGYMQMYEVHQLAPYFANRVEKYMAGRALEKWKDSTIFNGYGPVDEFVSDFHDTVKPISGDQHAGICMMMHEAMRLLNSYTGEVVPDHIYKWMKHPSPK